MQTTSQLTWRVDQAEVQDIVNVLSRYTKRRPLITFYGMDIIELRRDIAIKDVESRLSILLPPLYAVMVFYEQDPSRMQIEKFNLRPYCGERFCCRIILPLRPSVAEVWLGRPNPDESIYNFIFIKGRSYDRHNILRAIKYYFSTKYNYIECEHYTVNPVIHDTLMRIWKYEMSLCEELRNNRDKLLDWMLINKKVYAPGRPCI